MSRGSQCGRGTSAAICPPMSISPSGSTTSCARISAPTTRMRSRRSNATSHLPKKNSRKRINKRTSFSYSLSWEKPPSGGFFIFAALFSYAVPKSENRREGACMTEMGESNVTLKNRRLLKMDGVSEVLSFDEDFVSVATALGKVEIEGKGLKIVQMSAESGDFTLEGRIDGLYYAAMPGEKKGLFARRAK
ncbi:MAG: hypothetical protein DBX93_02295 [Oscillospiraceae bacterium]|nr:MAG: hypothetical protein DBX93_02295 [Oscillospiraceae bacterium]